MSANTTLKDEEDDPADGPDSPGIVTSPQELNLPLATVKLEDCSDMLGPDGIFKVQIVDGPTDEWDHCEPLSYPDGDDDDRGCNLDNPEHAENQGEKKRQSRDKWLKKKHTSTKFLKRGRLLIGTSTKSTTQRGLWRDKTPRNSHKCRECGERFGFPTQLFIHQQRHVEKRRRVAMDHTYAASRPEPCNEKHNSANYPGEKPQLGGLASTDPTHKNTSSPSPHKNTSTDSTHKNISIDSSNTGSLQQVDGEDCASAAAPNRNHLAVTIDNPHGPPQVYPLFRLIKLHPHQKEPHQQKGTGDARQEQREKQEYKQDQRGGGEQKEGPPERKRATYECDVCGKILSKKESLKIHKRLHTGERPFACKQCDKTFIVSSNLIRHQLTHSGLRPRFECDVCGKMLLTKEGLNFHKGTHADTKRFACQHCDKAFALRTFLRVHMRVHTAEKRYLCTECGKAFGCSSSFSNHKKTHSGEKPYKCSVCDKAFRNSSHMKIHLRMHTGERPYSCSQCPKSFPTTGQLKKHKYSHSDEKPYLCLLCGLRCKTKQSLQTHEWFHTGEKPFSCTHCSKAFRFKYLLAEHIRTHTGEKPYKCPDCEEKFRSALLLRYHQVQQHAGEKPHSCDVCGKAFLYAPQLTAHRRVHTHPGPTRDYKCSICEKKFPSPKLLQLHQQNEHDLKSRNCQLCGRYFKTARALVSHACSQGVK